MSIEAKINRDRDAFKEAWLDTPVSSPKGKSRDEAFMTPGCHVKSKERRDDGPWPKYFGKLTKISDDSEVVVIGKDDEFVWTSDLVDYHSLWECD